MRRKRRFRYVVAGTVVSALVGAACAGPSHTRAASTTTTASSPLDDLTRDARAAEAALRDARLPAEVVVVRASTGQVLASARRGARLPADDPLDGRYPTGSTYKIVTATALLEHGSTPATAVSCPASVTIDGRTVTNFGGRAQSTSTLLQAFAQSCNTAFAALGANLPDDALATAASQLGLGTRTDIAGAFDGTVAQPSSRADRAVTASDGGLTRVSPLALATVAATIDSGSLHRPHLTGPNRTGRRLSASVLAGLRSMMAAAVETGTASGVGLPPGTYAKTGTAQADGDASGTVYAWLVGYRGDIAFAVLVIGGSEGGPTAGPIAARLLADLG